MQEGRRREPHPAMLRYKGLEGQMVGKKFTSIHPEIGIKKIASNKMRDNWNKNCTISN
jgi:hypothetical protein